MNAQEIIQILKSRSVSAFAQEDWLELIPEDFIFSAEVQEQEIKKEKAHQTYVQCTDEKKKLELFKEYYYIPIYNLKIKEWLEATGLGNIEVVDHQGGEGQGEDWWKVFYFPAHDVYLKVVGYYTSYDGVSIDGWEDVKEVRPQQKTITVYQ